jgi:hypothetical protein
MDVASTPWAESKTIGAISEIAVMSPIKMGLVPGERRTYEQRLRELIDVIAARHARGVPTLLDKVRTIHFGRMMIIRPEQYLVGSKVDGVRYAADAPTVPVPTQMDLFVEATAAAAGQVAAPQLRSWLLTLVEFDGDLRVYMRDVARYLADSFDQIYENCDDFPTTEKFDDFWLWIRRYQINTDFFYAPDRDMTVARAREFERFKRAFDQQNAKRRRRRKPTAPAAPTIAAASGSDALAHAPPPPP